MEKEITFRIELDESRMPERIEWEATDGQGVRRCHAMLLSLWDADEKTTLAIDLWTKELLVDDLNIHYFQTLMKMADTHERATGTTEVAQLLNAFARDFAKRVQLPLPTREAD